MTRFASHSLAAFAAVVISLSSFAAVTSVPAAGPHMVVVAAPQLA